MNTASPVSNSPFSAPGQRLARAALAETKKTGPAPADNAILDESFSSIQADPETTECEKMLSRLALSFPEQDTGEALAIKHSILSSISAAMPGAPGAAVSGAVIRAYQAAGENPVASKLFKPAFRELKKASFATAREKVCADITSSLSSPKGMTASVSGYMAALTAALASGYNGPAVPLIRQVTGEQLNKSPDSADRLRILSRGLAAIYRDPATPLVDRAKAFFAISAAENIFPASKSHALAVLEAGLNEIGAPASGDAAQELAAMALKTAGNIGENGSFCAYHGLNTITKLPGISPLKKEAAAIALDVIAEKDTQDGIRHKMLEGISTMADEDCGSGLAGVTLKLAAELEKNGSSGVDSNVLNSLYGSSLKCIKEARHTSDMQKKLAEHGLNISTGVSWWEQTSEDTRLLMKQRREVLEQIRDATSPEFLAREEIKETMDGLQQFGSDEVPERIIDLDDDTLFIDGLRLGKNNQFAHFALFKI